VEQIKLITFFRVCEPIPSIREANFVTKTQQQTNEQKQQDEQNVKPLFFH
jgi:hypothetical protein